MTDMDIWLAPSAEQPPIIAIVTLAWVFVVSACWGSFLNVVIARVPKGESIVTPRSRCPKCATPISGFDNIPVLSWLILRGKCRSCRAPIAWRYPFIEFVIGVAGAACVARSGISVASLELFVFICILTAIAFIDLDTWTVPHPMWIALAGSGLAFAGIESWLAHSTDELVDRGIGAAGAGIAMACVVVIATGIARRTGRIPKDAYAMGWGDPLILVGIGAFLGWRLLPLVIFAASVQGVIAGLVARAGGGLQGDKPVSDDDPWVPPKGAVPFGPFLALGALEAAFFGDAVVGRVLDLLLPDLSR